MNEAETITLSIPKEKYNFLLKTVKEFKTRIYSWGFDKFMSKKLMTDLRIIDSILTTNKMEEKNHDGHNDKRPDSVNNNSDVHRPVSV